MRAPNSYFTTAFSGSARAQRARLANLFAGERRRGILPLALVLLCAVLLGGLVSCQPTAPEFPAPTSTGGAQFPVIIPDEIFDNVPRTVYRPLWEMVMPGGELYEDFVSDYNGQEGPDCDQAEIVFLREDWSYDRLGAVPDTNPAAVKVYTFGVRFHTNTPDRVSLAGSPELTDDGWFTPSYEGAHRLIFEEQDGVLTYQTYVMVNDSSPGDPLFTDDLIRALQPAYLDYVPPDAAAYCAQLIRPQPEVMKLTAFSQAARFKDVGPGGGRVEVWYLAWQSHLGDIGLVSSTYYTYCFFFMDADGALLHAQAAQVTGDDLYGEAAALWETYTAP